MNSLLLAGISTEAFPVVTQAADSAHSVVIAATGAEQSITVPAGAVYAKFTTDASFYATFDNTTVAVPGDSNTSGSTVSVLNPDVKYIRNVVTIKINAPELTHITVEFFS